MMMRAEDCTRDNRRGQMARVAGFRSIRLLLATGISVPLLFASSQIYAAFAPVERPSHAEPGNWPGYGGGYGEQHYSDLAQINAANVGKLGLAWSIDLAPGNSSSVPLEVDRSEEHTSELQSLMRSSYAVFCLKKKNKDNTK